MKKLLLLLLIATTVKLNAQQNYCNYEGVKDMHFGWYSGDLDSMHVNPGMDGVNASAFCAKYIRDTNQYDNLNIYPNAKLVDVSPYDFNALSSPKIRMKLYSSAPVGTNITLQLGTKLDNTYPSGIHSEFSAVTTMQNAWQLVTFSYSGIPSGSMVGPTDVDKIVILFHPNSAARDTMYMDDLTGPELITSGIDKKDLAEARLFQNTPNPAKEKTTLSFQLNEPGHVSLKIYDIVGNLVTTVVEDELKQGAYNYPLETLSIPNGVYFYTLQAGSVKRSMKMIVSK